MLISQLPAHLRAQAEAERERQRPGNQNDDLETAFDWLKYGDEYWFNINLGNFPPRTYPAEDVDMMAQALKDIVSLQISGKVNERVHKIARDTLATFKSKYPGV